jgi:hypothetical protein
MPPNWRATVKSFPCVRVGLPGDQAADGLAAEALTRTDDLTIWNVKALRGLAIDTMFKER